MCHACRSTVQPTFERESLQVVLLRLYSRADRSIWDVGQCIHFAFKNTLKSPWMYMQHRCFGNARSSTDPVLLISPGCGILQMHIIVCDRSIFHALPNKLSFFFMHHCMQSITPSCLTSNSFIPDDKPPTLPTPAAPPLPPTPPPDDLKQSLSTQAVHWMTRAQWLGVRILHGTRRSHPLCTHQPPMPAPPPLTPPILMLPTGLMNQSRCLQQQP